MLCQVGENPRPDIGVTVHVLRMCQHGGCDGRRARQRHPLRAPTQSARTFRHLRAGRPAPLSPPFLGHTNETAPATSSTEQRDAARGAALRCFTHMKTPARMERS